MFALPLRSIFAATTLAVTALCTIATPAHARNMLYGVNGHDNWRTPFYLPEQAEAVFKMLDKKNLRVYRVDVENTPRGHETLDRLTKLGRKYNILIRPMLYVDNEPETAAYVLAKKYAADINVWELGNELNLRGPSTHFESIAKMKAARAGIDRASAETGVPLSTTLNVTAGGKDYGLDDSLTTYTFVDRAIAAGLKFDIISYHYYPRIVDRGMGWINTYLDPLRKYGKPVFINETGCGEIYDGDDGNSAKCVGAAESLLLEVEENYADMVKEINMYELFDNKDIKSAEGHFGLMFDINNPKLTMNMLASHAADTDAPYLYARTARHNYAMDMIKKSPNAAFVNTIYNQTLNRVPDENGIKSWSATLDGKGKTRIQVAAAFLTSNEFAAKAAKMNNRAFVARVIVATAWRPATQQELDYYTSQLNKKSMTRTQLISAWLNSDVFKSASTRI